MAWRGHSRHLRTGFGSARGATVPGVGSLTSSWRCTSGCVPPGSPRPPLADDPRSNRSLVSRKSGGLGSARSETADRLDHPGGFHRPPDAGFGGGRCPTASCESGRQSVRRGNGRSSAMSRRARRGGETGQDLKAGARPRQPASPPRPSRSGGGRLSRHSASPGHRGHRWSALTRKRRPICTDHRDRGADPGTAWSRGGRGIR